MVGRLPRVIGTVVVMVVAFVTPVLATAAPASADTVINGCTIVSNPTPTNFTNCPGADLSGANLSGVDLSYANLAGATLVSLAGEANLSNANLSSANLTGATLIICFLSPEPGLFLVSCGNPTLTGANLTDANLTNTNLAACAIGRNGNNVTSGCGGLNLSGLDLSGANFSRAAFGACQPPGGPTGCAQANLSGATLTGINLTGANLTAVNLTGANLTGATLTGANLTGTVLVPSNQNVAATSDAGTVVTWPAPVSLPGATVGSCTPPPSGSTFPVGTTTITCQVLDGQGNVATGTFTVRVGMPEVLIPSNGATLSGTAILDGGVTDPSAVAAFQYELTGGSYTNQVVATAQPTLYGWLAQESNGTWGWDSTSVPSGTYTLTAVVTYNDLTVVNSPGVTVTVSNPAPTAQVLIPSNGATVSGTTVLDGTASYTPNITQFIYELDGAVIGGSFASPWGWLLPNWTTTTVANGSHTLTAVADYTDGATATSPGVMITVSNP
jgi:uncharacterized protein YjbI with pentapeptide repeats